MPAGERPFINVDALMAGVTLEDVCRYYGVPLPEVQRIGEETRMRCFLLHCSHAGETGERAISMQEGHPAKAWKCHHYGCPHGGSLMSMLDLLAPGESQGGHPRGARFRALAEDLRAIVGKEVAPESAPRAAATIARKPKKEPENLPLLRSENPRARELVRLDEKFLLPSQLEKLPPPASAYFRKRPWLSDDVAKAFRMGYLPRDSGRSREGGSQRGKVVFPWLSDAGELLTWFGRNVNFEVEEAAWLQAGKTGREPEKYHFVKGFLRGLEIWNQHAFASPATIERVKELRTGLLLVEGPNDVMRLCTLGVPAVALCSCQITREQAVKVASLARRVSDGIVTVMLDLDEPGLSGMKRALGFLSQLTPVRLAWSPAMYGGKFSGKQPESLTPEGWKEIVAFLAEGTATWQLS